MRATALSLVLVAAVAASAAPQPNSSAAGTLGTAAARFFGAAGEPLTTFRAFRHLEATNARFKKHGWLDAVTTLSSETGFSFQIVAEGGSAYILSKVLRPVLEAERDFVAQGDFTRTALTRDNYDIAGEEPAGSNLVRLLVKPRREETTLIDGAWVVTDDEADLVRIEGRLAKNPSFWTRRVDIVRHYGRLVGVRVPLSVESVAHIRIAGRSTLTMSYRYEMVNGRDVGSDASTVE